MKTNMSHLSTNPYTFKTNGPVPTVDRRHCTNFGCAPAIIAFLLLAITLMVFAFNAGLI